MRGTVFAVAAESLAWLTQLCAAAPLRAAIARRGRLEPEEHHLPRARQVLAELAADQSAPGTGRGVLRKHPVAAWGGAGARTAPGRGYRRLVEMITFRIAAYGPWRDGETAVVLARTWLPAGSDLEGTFNGDRAAAAAELARRYLTCHGPAGERALACGCEVPLGKVRAGLPPIEGARESRRTCR